MSKQLEYELNKHDTRLQEEDEIGNLMNEVEDMLKEELKNIIAEVVPEKYKEYFEGVDIDVSY